jgi:hypothetical protein
VQLPAACGKRPGLGDRLEEFELAQIHEEWSWLMAYAISHQPFS